MKRELRFDHLPLKSALNQAKEFISTMILSEFLEANLKNASVNTRQDIEQRIQDVDHVGFMVPPETDTSHLGRLCAESGFPDGHSSFASKLMSQELGELLERDPIPTQIFRCCTKGAAVELFIPSVAPQIAAAWIKAGVGTHVAFLVKAEQFVDQIKDALLKDGFSMPRFMKNKSMKNTEAKTLTAYFDLKDQNPRLRVEFLYVGPSKKR